MLATLLAQLETEEEKILIEKLYYEYESQMYSTAFAILQHKQDAEDAVQSAFLKIIEYLPTLDLELNPQTRSLLILLTRNIALNEMKKENNNLNMSLRLRTMKQFPLLKILIRSTTKRSKI